MLVDLCNSAGREFHKDHNIFFYYSILHPKARGEANVKGVNHQ